MRRRRRTRPGARGWRTYASSAAHVVPITDYGVIGNLETAALVSPAGSIDWACLPHFSSPSIVARILDLEKGGFQEVVPARSFGSYQEYLPGTNVLRTRFPLPGRKMLSVVDFLPIAAGGREAAPPVIVRIVSARGGPIRVATTFDARLGYAQDETTWESDRGGGIASGWSGHVTYTHPAPLTFQGSVARGSGTVEPGRPWGIEIIWGPRPSDLGSPSELCGSTVRFWQSWVRRGARPLSRLPRLWRRFVLRSELALKLLSQRRTGAFVAAATTSLPEWPGGPRNWDYRYAWFRDAAFSAQALLLLGHMEEAERFLRWVVGRLDDDEIGRHQIRVLYDAHGAPLPRERELTRLRGYAESRPVRIGNLARDQFQLDIFGELLAAAFVLAHIHEAHVARYWPSLRRLASDVEGQWKRPDHGIWETRGPAQHFVHSKVMAWVAMDRAAELARRFEGLAASEHWAGTAQKIRETIMRNGFDERRNAFVQAFGSREPDSANLRLPLVRFLPFDDPRIVGTVRYIGRELCDGPFVRRFRTVDDPLGSEAAFLPCSFWRVECRARMGELEEARADWDRLVRAAGPLGLFSEEYDPAGDRALGNYPQALTHIGVLRCAFALASLKDPEEHHRAVPHLLEYVAGDGPSRRGGASRSTV